MSVLKIRGRAASRAVLGAAFLGAAAPPPAAASRWWEALRLDMLAGGPLDRPARLEVLQEGEERLTFDASFRTDPFRPPIYWALRIGRERQERGWGLELMHNKLFLESSPAEITGFEITHGFNHVTVQRARPAAGFQLRLGLGGILAHPENEVRSRRLDETKGLLGTGYHLTGPVAFASLSRRVPFGGPVALALEARASVARVHVPVHGGQARFQYAALHLLFGLSAGPAVRGSRG